MEVMPKRRPSVAAGASRPEALDAGEAPARTPSRREKAVRSFDALVRFTRPHTMLGTAVSVTSVSLLALDAASDLTPRFALCLAAALSSALAMNVSIVGLNQVYDVEIDRVNKPYLPLASGEMSIAWGRRTVALSAAASLAVGLASGSAPLVAALVSSLVLGVFYSADLPLLRWKRFPVLAAACILCVRALIVQLGFYAHARLSVLHGTGQKVRLASSLGLAFGTGFMLLFSVVIALFKDLPDIAGDEGAGVRTLSVALGPRFVFRTCLVLLGAAYAAAMVVGLLCTTHWWSAYVTVASHAILGSRLFQLSADVDLGSSKSLYELYMFIWKLFYAEYALLPFIR